MTTFWTPPFATRKRRTPLRSGVSWWALLICFSLALTPSGSTSYSARSAKALEDIQVASKIGKSSQLDM